MQMTFSLGQTAELRSIRIASATVSGVSATKSRSIR